MGFFYTKAALGRSLPGAAETWKEIQNLQREARRAWGGRRQGWWITKTPP
jgi:hypothetical protein